MPLIGLIFGSLFIAFGLFAAVTGFVTEWRQARPPTVDGPNAIVATLPLVLAGAFFVAFGFCYFWRSQMLWLFPVAIVVGVLPWVWLVRRSSHAG